MFSGLPWGNAMSSADLESSAGKRTAASAKAAKKEEKRKEREKYGHNFNFFVDHDEGEADDEFDYEPQLGERHTRGLKPRVKE